MAKIGVIGGLGKFGLGFERSFNRIRTKHALDRFLTVSYRIFRVIFPLGRKCHDAAFKTVEAFECGAYAFLSIII